MQLPEITNSHSWTHPVTLLDEDGERVAVTAADTVRAIVLSQDRTCVVVPAQAVDVATPQAGSDLAQGVVVPVLSVSATAGVDEFAPVKNLGVGYGLLVIEVNTAAGGTTVRQYTVGLVVLRHNKFA